MTPLGQRGIRFKIVLVAVFATLVATVVLVAVTAFAMERTLENLIVADLEEHLDKAQQFVEVGDFDDAVDFAGSDIMQVIDSNGKVVASSLNARGLAAIVDEGDAGEYEIDDKRLEVVNGAVRATLGEELQDRIAEWLEDRRTEEEAAPADDAASEDGARDASSAGARGRAADDDDDDDEGVEDGDEVSGRGASGAGSGSGEVGSVVYGEDDEYDGSEDREDEGSGAVAERDDDGGDDVAEDDSDDDSADDADDDADEGDDEGVDDDDDDDDAKTKGAPASPAKPSGSPVATDAADASEASAEAASSDASSAPTREADGAPSPGGGPEPGNAAGGEDDAARSAGAAKRATAGQPAAGPYIDASSVLGEDGPYVVMSRRVDSPSGAMTVAAMTSLAPAVRAARVAAQILVMAMLVVLAVVALVSWRLVSRTLEPVDEMRRSVEAMGADDLSARVAVPAHDRDLAPLATTFNDLLARIEQAVNDHKRFISDASHELKSPIAATGIMLETMRSYPDAVDVEQAIDDLKTENDRMSRIVGNMLVLARDDEGRSKVEKAPLDLLDMITEEAYSLSARSAVSVDLSRVEPVVLSADGEMLSSAMRNLLDNAARHASSTVQVTCVETDGAVRVAVSDDGAGIAPEDRERVFGRFVRLGDSPDDSGTGLGLSVVKSVVEQHGGTVRFGEPELGGATVVMEFPVAGA